MAKSLGLKVVAEGVENKQEAEILCQEECDYLQGYYYSQPLKFDAFKQYCLNNQLQQNKSRST